MNWKRYVIFLLIMSFFSNIIFYPWQVLAANKTIEMVSDGKFDQMDSWNQLCGQHDTYDLVLCDNLVGTFPWNKLTSKTSVSLGSVNQDEFILQTDIPLPFDAEKITLSYIYEFDTSDTELNDEAAVMIADSSNSQLLMKKSYWPRDGLAPGPHIESIDLTPYAGKFVNLSFGCGNNNSLATSFLIDDVSIRAEVNDTTAPVGSVLINNGAKYTNKNEVRLSLKAKDDESGTLFMGITNYSDYWAEHGDGTQCNTKDYWDTYYYDSAMNNWDLQFGTGMDTEEGTKYVCVWYKDVDQNISKVYRDAIIYDKTAPKGKIRINKNRKITRSKKVTLSIRATDIKWQYNGDDVLKSSGSGVSTIRISNNGKKWTEWKSYKSKLKWYITKKAYGGNSKKGRKRVYIQFMDKAGNVSKIYSDSIRYR